MNVHIEYDYREGEHRVYLYDRRAFYTMGEDGRLVGHERTEKAEIAAPTFSLPREVLEALLKAAGTVVQANDATVDALNDTRQVRDRLLALVERSHA